MLLKEQYSDEELNALLIQAMYHLGQVLYLGEIDFDQAVSLLEDSVDMDPENTAAYYYLGQAILAQVERNTYVRAENVLRTYLQRGAPLGYEEDVRQFLGVRRRQRMAR